MPLRENQLKATLKRGEVIIGTLMKQPRDASHRWGIVCSVRLGWDC